jgi:hypothetical protein
MQKIITWTKKVVKDGNRKHVQMWGCLHASSRHLWRLYLLQNSHYSRKILNSNLLLQKSTIIGISRLCAKSPSLGNCLNCFWYIGTHGPTMHVEPYLGLLAILKCPCCGNIIRMLKGRGPYDIRFQDTLTLMVNFKSSNNGCKNKPYKF